MNLLLIIMYVLINDFLFKLYCNVSLFHCILILTVIELNFVHYFFHYHFRTELCLLVILSPIENLQKAAGLKDVSRLDGGRQLHISGSTGVD